MCVCVCMCIYMCACVFIMSSCLYANKYVCQYYNITILEI